MYNYWIVSAEETLIVISASTSECKEILTLNFPKAFISSTGCIIEGFISILFSSWISFEISVGLTEPYNSLFSVLSFFTEYSLLLICSAIWLASFFFSLSFFDNSALIFSTSFIFSFDASKENIKEVEKIKAELSKKDNEKKKEANQIAEQINNKEYSVKKLSTENNELYGSVKPTEISKLIQEENKIDIKPSMIQPVEEIKALGKFKVKISLHSEVDAEITINVSSADTIQ